MRSRVPALQLPQSLFQLRAGSGVVGSIAALQSQLRFLSPEPQDYRVWGAGTTQGSDPSRSNIILGEHISGALIQLLCATYFFKARQQIVRP